MTTIQLFGDIGVAPCTPDAVSAALANAGGGPVCVEINTNGGSVWDGLAIYNALAAYPGPVTCKVVGLAASMGSVIALAGDELRMASNAFLMIHNPSVVVEADAGGLRQTADWMAKVHDTLAQVYVGKSGKPHADVIAAMEAETWFTADEALAWGFASAIDPTAQNKATVRQVAAAYRAKKPTAAAPETVSPQLVQEILTMAKAITKRGAAAEVPAPTSEELPPAEPAAPAVVPASPESVEAVDTSSADYKMGQKCGAEGVNTGSPDFLAGYAAGKSGPAAEPAAEEKPAEEEKPKDEPAMNAAKIADLRAAFPNDPGFVIDQIERGASLIEAKAAYADVLSAKLNDANAKLAKATTGQAPIATAGAVGNATAKADPNDPKAQAAAEWDSDESVRKGFSTKERYVAVRAAELKGQLRVR